MYKKKAISFMKDKEQTKRRLIEAVGEIIKSDGYTEQVEHLERCRTPIIVKKITLTTFQRCLVFRPQAGAPTYRLRRWFL